jgi:hypothetical protein
MDSSTDEEGEDQSPRTSINRFLYALTEWLSVQINDSPTRSFGPQKVMGTVLRSLAITDDTLQRELALYILKRAPVLAGQ